jgi:hypothetical protein
MILTPSVLLLTATIADICITLFGIGVGCFETNPIVASYGWVTMLVGKLVATLLVVFALNAFRNRLGGLAFIPGRVVSLVVLWNVLIVSAQLM